MSFLKIGDRAAGAIKSGGTTRRAAKMVVVDIDHPDIEAYIDWKVKEEQKVAALVTGSKICQKRLKAIMKACVNCEADGRRLLRSRQEPGAQARHQGGAARPGARQLHPPRHPVRAPGLQGHRLRRPTTPTGTARPTSPSPARTPTTRCASPTSSSTRSSDDEDWDAHGAPRRQDRQDAEGPRPVGEDRLRRLGLGRSRHPVPHHHQRLAHLPEVGADPRVQPVLGIHVPRRHGLQPGLAEPDDVPRRRQALRRRRLRARLPAVDHRARNLGADGAVPVQEDRRAVLSLPHAGPGLRQHRRLPDGVRHSLRQPRGPRHLRRALGHHDRRRLRHLGRDGRASWAPSPATSPTRPTCCA